MADISTIVKELFTHVPDRSNNDELVFICPQCDDTTGNRSVNLRSGLTNCWKCGKRPGHAGNFIWWCRSLGYKVDDADKPIELTEAEKLLNEVEKEKFVPSVVDITLPRGFKRLADDMESGYVTLIERMAKRKGLALDDMLKAGVGFTTEHPLWEPYAIFPVHEYERLVYYQGRTYVDEPGKSTKRFPNRTECPYGMQYWVYNIDKIREQKPWLVVCVESILNVLSLEKLDDSFVTACVFKHSVSPAQLQKITGFSWVEEVCMLYDSDSTADAWIEAGSRITNRVRVSVAKMPIPDGKKKIDPNDEPELALEAIRDRKSYTVAGELGALLEGL